MPFTRRRLLTRTLGAFGAGLATAGLSACDPLGRSHPARRPRPPAVPDPVLALVTAEQALLAQYDAVLAAFPAIRGASDVRADHAAHLEALRALVHPPAAGPAPSRLPGAAPATAAAAQASLRAAETGAAARFTEACLTAPAPRAALLGSIAACESAHLVLLR